MWHYSEVANDIMQQYECINIHIPYTYKNFIGDVYCDVLAYVYLECGCAHAH